MKLSLSFFHTKDIFILDINYFFVSFNFNLISYSRVSYELPESAVLIGDLWKFQVSVSTELSGSWALNLIL